MTILAVVALALVAVCIIALVLRERDHAKEREATEQRHDAERQTLLERIQRPERTPAGLTGEQLELPEPEPDDAHLVGTIAPLDEAFLADELAED